MVTIKGSYIAYISEIELLRKRNMGKDTKSGRVLKGSFPRMCLVGKTNYLSNKSI